MAEQFLINWINGIENSMEEFYLFFHLFCHFRAPAVAYGGSQARGLIRAVAAATATAARDPSPVSTYATAHSNARSLTH